MTIKDLPRLEACGWSSSGEAANARDVEHIESMVGASLPPDYREFQLSIGPGDLDAFVPCSYPTPFGEAGVVELFSIEQVEQLLDSSIVPRNMICIGTGHFGKFTCLAVCGLDRGAVYCLDSEMNFYKNMDSAQQFYQGSPLAEEFYRLRDADELPQRPWGYENCYHITDTFLEFLDAIRPD